MLGQLFTQEFLKTGICDTPLWRSVADAELDAFITDLKAIYAPFRAGSNLNEPVTENEILVRVLVKLGWTDILTQGLNVTHTFSGLRKMCASLFVQAVRDLLDTCVVEALLKAEAGHENIRDRKESESDPLRFPKAVGSAAPQQRRREARRHRTYETEY